MKQCRECGTISSDDTEYCYICGTKFRDQYDIESIAPHTKGTESRECDTPRENDDNNASHTIYSKSHSDEIASIHQTKPQATSSTIADNQDSKGNHVKPAKNRPWWIIGIAAALALAFGLMAVLGVFSKKQPASVIDANAETHVPISSEETTALETQSTMTDLPPAPVYGSIDGAWMHTVGIKSDGTVVNTVENGNSFDYSEWSDIVKVSCGANHDLGLRRDGTVVACGYSGDGACDIYDWRNITDIAAGNSFSVGLRKDGSVYFAGKDWGTGMRDQALAWKNIVAIAAGNGHLVGLKNDGTVIACGDNTHGQCDVAGWNNIISVVAGNETTIGLRSDGTVVATGLNDTNQCDVAIWNDIIGIAAGWGHTIGLKRDGTVVATGYNEDGRCNVTDWTSIVEIACGTWHSIGLLSDGTVVAVGTNEGQCDVSGWSGIRLPHD